MKRIILILLAISMIFGTLIVIGCNSKETTETTESVVETVPETEPESTTALIFDKDSMHYTVVRSTYAGSIAIDAVKEIEGSEGLVALATYLMERNY